MWYELRIQVHYYACVYIVSKFNNLSSSPFPITYPLENLLYRFISEFNMLSDLLM